MKRLLLMGGLEAPSSAHGVGIRLEGMVIRYRLRKGISTYVFYSYDSLWTDPGLRSMGATWHIYEHPLSASWDLVEQPFVIIITDHPWRQSSWEQSASENVMDMTNRHERANFGYHPQPPLETCCRTNYIIIVVVWTTVEVDQSGILLLIYCVTVWLRRRKRIKGTKLSCSNYC